MSIPFELVLLLLVLSARAQQGSQGNTYIFGGAQMTFYGTHNFLTGGQGALPGIIGTVRSSPSGVLNFAATATSHTGANDASHVDGYVRKLGSGSFIFPTGDNGHYGPFAAAADGTTGAYFFVDPTSAVTSNLAGGNYAVLPTGGPFPSATKASSLSAVSTKEYWDIDGANATRITLTWSSSSAIGTLTGGDLNKLTVAGWDGTQWVRIPSAIDATSVLGGASDLTAGSITSTSTLTPNTYTAYTFAEYVPVTQPIFACTPGQSFLFQSTGSNPTDAYVLDLATGNQTLAKTALIAGTANNYINAIGYNVVDNYIWGYRGGTNQIVRVGSDWSVQTFTIPGLPAGGGNINTGDVAKNGIMYLYEYGTTNLYKIDLNPGSAAYLQAVVLTTTSSNIADFAVNPVNGFIYAVEVTGTSPYTLSLIRFNPNTGNKVVLGPVSGGGILSETGGFGGAFMDTNGNLYVSNNISGNIFKIAATQTSNTLATLQTSGSPSSGNDGARCPSSEAVVQTPFACAPGQSFLFQSVTNGPTGAYTYDLNTGVATLGKAQLIAGSTNNNINAIGYNVVDNYIWGYRVGTNELVRVGSDWSVQTFAIPGLPASVTSINTGDVDKNGSLYLYQSLTTTLYKVDLNPASAAYLQAIPLTTTASNIVDFAVNPVDNQIYAVEVASNNPYALNLIKFNPATGTKTVVGALSGAILTEVGGFGAAFMDANGTLYVSNNTSGNIYKISSTQTGNRTAVFNSSGTPSAGNDGARCPNSPVGPSATSDVASTAVGAPVTIDVLSNDTPGSTALVASSVRLIDPTTNQPVTSLTISGQGTYVVNTSTGQVTFTPDPAFTGTATPVSYRVTDANGLTAQATLTVSVTGQPVTTPATPNPDANVTYVGVPVPGNVATNDKLPAGTTYGTPTASTNNPLGGTLTLSPDGIYSFTSTTPGSFTYTVPVCAPGQSTGCPTQPLVITVLPIPSPVGPPAPPVALVDIATIKGDPTTPPTVTVDVRQNDKPSDPAGTLDPPTITTPPAHGTATVGPDGRIAYTPNPGYYGDDVITYQVCESPSGLCTTAQEVIHVLPPAVTNSTLAGDDYVATTAGTPVSGNVKTNDTDPEGNTQTVNPQTTTTPAGSLTLNSDGSYTFMPTQGFSGPASFTYTTCDNGSPQACASATLYILVAPPAPDLTPVIYARPSTVAGTTAISVVVDVFELSGVATSGTISVKLSKDPLFSLGFNPTATTIGGRGVSNAAWSLSGPSGGFYTLTTNQVIPAGGVLSFGLEGTLTPGATSGTLTVSTGIVAGSGSEIVFDNNTDADKIDYFQQ